MTKLEKMLYEAMKNVEWSGEYQDAFRTEAACPRCGGWERQGHGACCDIKAALAAFEAAQAAEAKFGEPWSGIAITHGCDAELIVTLESGGEFTPDESTIARIVAAVNALAGRPTEEI
jgi:hypothetical protein